MPFRTIPPSTMQLDAGDVARGVRGEEDDRVGDLLRRGDAAERDAVLVVAAHLGRVGDRVQRRVGRPRREGVDGDPVRPELDGERLRQPEDPALRGHVRRQLRDRLHVDDRRDVDDPAAAALGDHLPGGGPAAVVVAVQVRRQQAVPVVVGHLQERLHHQARGVVHPDVDPAPGRHRLAGQLVDVRGIAAVALEDDRLGPRRPDLRGRSLGLRRCALEVEGDLRARPRERDRRGGADALRGAGDHRPLSGQVDHSVRYLISSRRPLSWERTIASQISAQR